MSIKFEKKDEYLELVYQPDYNNAAVVEKLMKSELNLKNTYTLTIENLRYPQIDKNKQYTKNDYEEMGEELQFRVAERKNGYYEFYKGIFSDEFDVCIFEEFDFVQKNFTAANQISIIGKILKVTKTNLVIGKSENDLNPDIFYKLVKLFPNSTELLKYSHSRIYNIIKDFYDSDKMKDRTMEYNNYINKKVRKSQLSLDESTVNKFKENDIIKYEYIYNHLNEMLEENHAEKKWQREMVDIIIVLFPKYIKCLENVVINDCDGRNKEIDYVLVDADGNIDIIEIKKPNDCNILSKHAQYRNNYIPLKTLSGTIMQTEKYLYYLNRNSSKNEIHLNKKYSNCFPEEFKIKITNPKGILILGRGNEFNEEQSRDFEIIKRKYKNIVDIITYDDLLKRLDNTIKELKRK